MQIVAYVVLAVLVFVAIQIISKCMTLLKEKRKEKNEQSE